jgi:hypothetical protein
MNVKSSWKTATFKIWLVLLVYWARPGNSMLLACNVASVTSWIHYAAIYVQRSGYRCKMAVTTAESSVGKTFSYYPLQNPMRARSSEFWVHRTTMNNFFTLITCTTTVLTPCLEMCLLSLYSFIRRNVLSNAHFIYINPTYPYWIAEEIVIFNKHRSIQDSCSWVNLNEKSVSIRDICIQPDNCVHNWHTKARWNLVFSYINI